MLDILLNMYSEKGTSRQALDILEKDYNIPLISVSREVDTMCNLSQGIYDDGMAKGVEKGRVEDRSEGAINKEVKVVKNLLAKGFTLEDALAVAGIDRETYENNCPEA